MAGRKKGTQKTGGRVKGTPNRLTHNIRQLLLDGIGDHIERIPEYLDSLEPKERLNAISKFLPYILPRQQTLEVKRLPTVEWLLLMPEEERNEKIKEIKGDWVR